MEYRSSPRLRNLVGVAREIAGSVVAENVEREDAEALWPEPAMRALADAGLMGLTVPEAIGGHGEGMSGLVAVSSTLAQESPSVALCFAMHCVGSAVIAAKATEYQKERYLEPIVQGRHLTTLALSEPGTGVYFWLPETRVTEAPEGFVMDGTKSFVTNGGHADSYVTSVAAEDTDEEGTFSCVVIDSDTPGVEWADQWLGLGMRGNSSRTMVLEHAPICRENLLGEVGDQLWYVFEVVAPYFLMAMAGTYLGVARASLEIAREHLASRRHTHTGELLGSNPLLTHRLGELWIEVEKAHHLVFTAAGRGDAGAPEALTAVLASKAAAGETAVRVANEAMTLAGGAGYRENGKLARMLRDARAAHVMTPTTDILKHWIGRALVNLPLI